MDAESQLLADQDAEIERSLLKHEKEKNVLLTSLEGAVAEIERLNKEVTHWTEMADQADIFVHRYQRENQELLSEIKRLKELIIDVIKMLKEVE